MKIIAWKCFHHKVSTICFPENSVNMSPIKNSLYTVKEIGLENFSNKEFKRILNLFVTNRKTQNLPIILQE